MIKHTKVAVILVLGFVCNACYSIQKQNISEKKGIIAGAVGVREGEPYRMGDSSRLGSKERLIETYPLVSSRSARITDEAGNVWAEDIDVNSEFVGVSTKYGTFILSAYPFKGSKVVASHTGKEVDLRFETLRLKWSSKTPLFSDESTARKVYGLFVESKKAGSVQVFEAPTEDRILSRVQGAVPATVLGH